MTNKYSLSDWLDDKPDDSRRSCLKLKVGDVVRVCGLAPTFTQSFFTRGLRGKLCSVERVLHCGGALRYCLRGVSRGGSIIRTWATALELELMPAETIAARRAAWRIM